MVDLIVIGADQKMNVGIDQPWHQGAIGKFATAITIGNLAGPDQPQESDAVRDLVDKAMAPQDDPLYVVAIGAITNVASAILLEPEIIKHIVVVWLGGTPAYLFLGRTF